MEGVKFAFPVCKNRKTQILDVHASFAPLGVGIIVKQRERKKREKGHCQRSSDTSSIDHLVMREFTNSPDS